MSASQKSLLTLRAAGVVERSTGDLPLPRVLSARERVGVRVQVATGLEAKEPAAKQIYRSLWRQECRPLPKKRTLTLALSHAERTRGRGKTSDSAGWKGPVLAAQAQMG